MRTRVTILVVLTLLTLTYRGTALYMRYFSPDLQTRSYFIGHYEGGKHVVIAAVDEDHPSLRDVPHEQRVQAGDRILEIYDGQGEGGPVRGLFDYGALLRPIGAEPWTMVVARPTDPRSKSPDHFERIEIAMPPATPVTWPLSMWTMMLGMDLFLPALAMVVGCLVGFLRPRDRLAFLAALMFISFSLWFRQPVVQFPPGVREMGYVLGTVAMFLAPYLFMHFFLLFPSRSLLDQRARWLRPAALAATLALCALQVIREGSLMLSFDLADTVSAGLRSAWIGDRALEWLASGVIAGMIVVSLITLARTAFRAQSTTDRRRSRIIAAGAALGLLPILVLSSLQRFGIEIPYLAMTAGIVIAGIFPASFAYAVVMHQVFGIRVILRRGLRYALVSKSFLAFEGVVLFAAMFYVTRPVMTKLLPPERTSLAAVGVGLATIGLVVGAQRLNRTVFPVIDRRFFRDVYDARTLLTQLSHAVRRLASRPDLLLSRVADEVLAALHPSRVAVFLREDMCSRVRLTQGPECSLLRWTGQIDPNAAPVTMMCCLARSAPGELLGRHPSSASFGAPVLAPRRPLARHLAQAGSSPRSEALDVIVVDRRLRQEATTAPARGNAPVGEREMLEQLDARLIVPLTTKERTLGFIVLGEKLSEEPYSAEDRELLGTVAEQAAIALDYSSLIEHVAARERLEREVQIASEVQARLLPSAGPQIEGLRYVARCRPARGVGGDFYDFIGLGPGRLGLGIGDVAGKGISAALLMASLQALLRSHAVSHGNAPDALASELNRHLCEATDDARFATFFFSVFDETTGRLRYINAGHVPPLVLRAAPSEDGALRVDRLGTSGMPIGLFPEESWAIREVQLRPGDRLMMFSDGLTEASRSGDEDMFGEDRLLEVIGRLGSSIDEQGLVDAVLEAADRFAGTGDPHDDITLIAARIT